MGPQAAGAAPVSAHFTSALTFVIRHGEVVSEGPEANVSHQPHEEALAEPRLLPALSADDLKLENPDGCAIVRCLSHAADGSLPRQGVKSIQLHGCFSISIESHFWPQSVFIFMDAMLLVYYEAAPVNSDAATPFSSSCCSLTASERQRAICLATLWAPSSSVSVHESYWLTLHTVCYV